MPRIIATLGPSCSDSRTLAAMIQAGADVFRINFSQGSLEEHAARAAALAEAGRVTGKAASVLGDLCGPRFRVGRIEPDCQVLEAGQHVTIVAECEAGDCNRFGTNYEHFGRDVRPGDRVFIDEGKLVLRVVSQSEGQVVCEVIRGGRLTSRKGINLPDTRLSAPAVTDEDWRCAHWAMDQGLEYLALSFVHSPQDVRLLRAGLGDAAIKVVAKIETRQVLDHLEDILEASDVCLLARGDLGVEVEPSTIPGIQRRLAGLCQDLGSPLWVATHILHSMITSPVPTRAEITDVATAVWQGADGLVLAGETAVGQHPVEVVRTLRQIITAAEGS
jgi:pyruvate kinase